MTSTTTLPSLEAEAADLRQAKMRLKDPDPGLGKVVGALLESYKELPKLSHPRMRGEPLVSLLFGDDRPGPSFTPEEDCDENDRHQNAAHWSVHVLKDLRRTARLVTSVMNAVADLEAIKGGTGPIRVHEVGCGATFILSLTAVLSSKRVDVSAVEISPVSVDYANKITRKFGVDRRCKIHVGDGCSRNVLPEAGSIDLALSETIGPGGLNDEPYAQVANALRPSLAPHGVFIPGALRVKVGLLPSDKESPGQVSSEELDKLTVASVFDAQGQEPGNEYVEASFTVPRAPGTYTIVCQADVLTYGQDWLSAGDSAMCTPCILGHIVVHSNGSATAFQRNSSSRPFHTLAGVAVKMTYKLGTDVKEVQFAS